MSFLVKYLQDIPNNCSECPCSVHITKDEVYCNARQKHFEVTDRRPDECEIIERSNVINPNNKPESCDECMHHRVDGLFDYCSLDYGMLLMDDNIDYEKNKEIQNVH